MNNAMKHTSKPPTLGARNSAPQYFGWERSKQCFTLRPNFVFCRGLVALILIATATFTNIARAFAQDLMVPVTVPWYDTGIDLLAGEQLKIEADGYAFYSSPAIFGVNQINPDGFGPEYDGTTFHPGTVLPEAIRLSLIGKIGGTVEIDTGIPLPEAVVGKGSGFVGSIYEMEVNHSGRLFLGFNDTRPNFGDNSGAFSVRVSVVPEPRIGVLLLTAVGIHCAMRSFCRRRPSC